MTTIHLKSGKNPYLQHVSTRHLEWLADEPEESGGQDQGPTPYELLLSSLASCTSITMQMYARRKEWPLDGVEVEAEHRRIHAEDCRDCESEKGHVSEIQLQIRLRGSLTQEQVEKLFEIAGKCPVKKTLEREIKIRSRLVEGSG